MSMTCSTQGINVYRILVKNYQGKRPLGDPDIHGKIILK
jgi:hypothetical protein